MTPKELCIAIIKEFNGEIIGEFDKREREIWIINHNLQVLNQYMNASAKIFFNDKKSVQSGYKKGLEWQNRQLNFSKKNLTDDIEKEERTQ
jgi:hypothetical protein